MAADAEKEKEKFHRLKNIESRLNVANDDVKNVDARTQRRIRQLLEMGFMDADETPMRLDSFPVEPAYSETHRERFLTSSMMIEMKDRVTREREIQRRKHQTSMKPKIKGETKNIVRGDWMFIESSLEFRSMVLLPYFSHLGYGDEAVALFSNKFDMTNGEPPEFSIDLIIRIVLDELWYAFHEMLNFQTDLIPWMMTTNKTMEAEEWRTFLGNTIKVWSLSLQESSSQPRTDDGLAMAALILHVYSNIADGEDLIEEAMLVAVTYLGGDASSLMSSSSSSPDATRIALRAKFGTPAMMARFKAAGRADLYSKMVTARTPRESATFDILTKIMTKTADDDDDVVVVGKDDVEKIRQRLEEELKTLE